MRAAQAICLSSTAAAIAQILRQGQLAPVPIGIRSSLVRLIMMLSTFGAPRGTQGVWKAMTIWRTRLRLIPIMWNIVAFVQRLPKMTSEEYERFAQNSATKAE